MIIKFPFAIKQEGTHSVSIDTCSPNGEPLVRIDPHQNLQVSDEKFDEIYTYVVRELILANIKVEMPFRAN